MYRSNYFRFSKNTEMKRARKSAIVISSDSENDSEHSDYEPEAKQPAKKAKVETNCVLLVLWLQQACMCEQFSCLQRQQGSQVKYQ